MVVQIPVRSKYRKGFKSRYKGGERPAPKKKRSKIGQAAHERLHGPVQRRTKVVAGGTGKSHMEDG